jgi:superfamily I DNA/RNA helicase
MRLSRWISNQKLQGCGPEEIISALLSDDPDIEIRATVYAKYEQYLKNANSFDFDDLLVLAVKLIEQNPKTFGWCNHVLVDELYVFTTTEMTARLTIVCSQDTSAIQYKFVRLLAERSQGLTVVGDLDQSSKFP